MTTFSALLRSLLLIAGLLSAGCVLSAQGLPTVPPGSDRAIPQIVSVSDLQVPEAAQKEFEKGRKLFLEKHKDAESIESLHKAIRLAPSFSLAHFLLGSIYLESARWQEAEQELRTAIWLNDKSGSAYLALGSCLFNERRFVEAEQALLRGNDLSPNIPQGNYELARTYLALGRVEDAEPIARKSVALNALFPDGHLALGFVLLRLQKNREALDELQIFLRLAPDSADAQRARDAVKGLTQVLTAMH
jgi:tetratricopeptide (TPR) repeat protein